MKDLPSAMVVANGLIDYRKSAAGGSEEDSKVKSKGKSKKHSKGGHKVNRKKKD